MRKRKEEILPFWDKPTVIFFFFLFSFFLHFLSFLQKKKTAAMATPRQLLGPSGKDSRSLEDHSSKFSFFFMKKDCSGGHHAGLVTARQTIFGTTPPRLHCEGKRGRKREKRKNKREQNGMEKKPARFSHFTTKKHNAKKKQKRLFSYLPK